MSVQLQHVLPSSTGATLEQMAPEYIPAYLEIKRQNFTCGLDEQDFMKCMPARRNRPQTGNFGLMAKKDNQVIAFVCFKMATPYLEVYDIEVAPDFQRKGIGTQIIDELKIICEKFQFQGLCMILHERDVPTQLFCRKQKIFHRETLRENCKETLEDEYLMMYILNDYFKWIASK